MSLKDTLVGKKEEPKASVYTGIYNLVDANAARIPLKDGVYYPLNEIQIKELEYQITQGRVCKS